MSTHSQNEMSDQPEEHMQPFNDATDAPATHPSSDVLYHQVFAFQGDATVTGDYFVPIYSSQNEGSQHENALAVNGYQINSAFSPPSLNSPYQWASQGSNHFPANADHFNRPVLSPSLAFDDDYSFLFSDAIADGSDATLRLQDFRSNNDFGGSDDFGNSASIVTTASGLSSFANSDIQKTVGSFAQLPVPTTSITTAAGRTNTNTSRLTCNQPGCTKTFARAGDLSRHRKMHSPGEHPCNVSNCDRKGDRAFYRPDKLRDHQRKKHRMMI